ncbi:MAK10-like protein [Tanacetum coccineum]
MGDENPIRTLGDYSKPSHEGYRNTIELPVGNNVVPLRSDTIRLVQNGCSFHGLRSEDPNQHLKDFLKLVDSLDLDGENRERTRLRLFQFSLRDQASNWLERLPAGSITTWEDLTTRFLAQFFPPGRTAKLRNDILMFQQHHGESLSEAWTRFKDLLLWNDPRDFAKPVKAITLPQDVPSTSDRRLIELENQVQRLMEAHLAPTQPTQVNKITTSCEIYSGPHDTQYCMEDPEQAFVEYASSCTDEAGGALPSDTVKNPKLGTSLVLFARSYPTIDPQCSSHPSTSINAIKVHIGKLKLLNDFYVIDIKKDPETPLLVGRGFLATANVVIDCRMAKIAAGEGITRLYLMRRSLEVLRKFHGIAKDILVEVVKHVYPVDFVILDIKEDEKRPFIIGTQFLTTAKAVIKFDKGTITLRSEKSKISFHRIPESLCEIERGVKNDIDPISPTMTVNRLVMEWEERIKFN